jgi:hypothetical protein
LYKRKDRRDKDVEGENALLRVHPTDSSAEGAGAIVGFLCWGSINILNLNAPAEEDT